jgi:hypothetical protein
MIGAPWKIPLGVQGTYSGWKGGWPMGAAGIISGGLGTVALSGRAVKLSVCGPHGPLFTVVDPVVMRAGGTLSGKTCTVVSGGTTNVTRAEENGLAYTYGVPEQLEVVKYRPPASVADLGKWVSRSIPQI